MNDFDLEAKLKRVLVPERSEEYWSDFPSRIRVQLRRIGEHAACIATECRPSSTTAGEYTQGNHQCRTASHRHILPENTVPLECRRAETVPIPERPTQFP